MAEVTRELCEKYLSSRDMVSSPCKVKTTLRTKRLYNSDKGTRIIYNTNLITPYLIDEANELYEAENFNEAANKCLTYSVPDSFKGYKPEEGTIVYAHVGYITTKEGKQALMITSIEPVEVVTTTKAKFNFSKSSAPAVVTIDDIDAEIESELTEVPEKELSEVEPF